MRRGGFTLIELVFVIVVLGILAAVALPKFVGVSEEAHLGKLKGFVGTLNRTVSPALWSKSLSDGQSGSIKNLNVDLKDYIEIPEEIDASDINLSKCGNSITNTSNPFAESNSSVISGYKIVCRDGNVTHAPAFALYDSKNKKILGPQE